MPKTVTAGMDQLCHTCGAIGYAELVATCSKCKVVCAHLYCMRIKLDAVPDFWLCEYCGLDDAKSPVDLGWKVKPKKGWIVKSRIKRHTKVCKVKYLSTEEVIKLSSGGMHGSPKLNMASTPKMTSISRKTTSSSMPRPLVQASKESQERSYGMTPPKDLGVKKQQLAARLPPIAKQTFKKAKVADILACASPVSKPTSPVMNSGVKDSSMKEVDIDCSYLPALNASWKGGFRFVNSLVAGVEFYGGFLAKPPCTVNRKAYEFSQKMPPVLQVQLQARSDIWDDLFDLDFLNLGDIALYFFPSENIERSSENNSSLFELMVREKLLIRSFIDGVELIIFTSKQLDADSQYVVNCLNSECRLFGIFRSIENDPSPSDILGEHPTVVPSVQHALTVPFVESAAIVPQLERTFNGNDNRDDDNVLDMEIDMMGGLDIRKPTIPMKDLDSTIQRLLLEFRPRAMESDVDTFPRHADQEPVPISAIGPDSLLLSNVKTEEGIDNKRWLKTDKSSRVVPTFSLDGSEEKRKGLYDEVVKTRVADKYLQIFNQEIKKEPPH